MEKVTARHLKSVTSSSFVSTLCWITCGYTYAMMSGIVVALEYNFIAHMGLASSTATLLLGLVVCSTLFGTIAGSLLARQVERMLGRKWPVLLAAALFIVAALGSAFPESGLGPRDLFTTEVLIAFVVYRFVAGLAVALASFVAPLQVAEFAPTAVRGQLGAYQQIAIAGGIFAALFVNWCVSLQGDDVWLVHTGWRYMCLALAVPATVLLLMGFTMPESPTWLVQRGRGDEARRDLARSTDPTEVEAAFAEIEKAASAPPQTKPLLSYGATVILVGMALNVLMQLVGLTAITYYGPLILQRAGYHPDEALLGVLFARGLNVAATMFVVLAVDRVGRKPLLMTGAAIMAFSMLLLALATMGKMPGMLAFGAMCLYLVGLGLSFGPIVWIVLSEIFPAPIRAAASSVSVWAQWGANLAVAVSFPVMFGAIVYQGATNASLPFWLYGACAVVAGLFVWRYVPETKGVRNEVLATFWRRRGLAPPRSRKDPVNGDGRAI